MKITKARREGGVVRLTVEAPNGMVFSREFIPTSDYTGTNAQFAQFARIEMIAYVKGQLRTPNSVRLDFEGEDVGD